MGSLAATLRFILLAPISKNPFTAVLIAAAMEFYCELRKNVRDNWFFKLTETRCFLQVKKY